jgi:hypothetical protein
MPIIPGSFMPIGDILQIESSILQLKPQFWRINGRLCHLTRASR